MWSLRQLPASPRFISSASKAAFGAGAAMQHRSRQAPLAPPCLYFLRGHCRFGTACRFSHDMGELDDSTLPFHHRQSVHSEAGASLAASAAAGTSAAPWRFRVMSYNVLADCLAHEHAAELYTSAPRFAREWGFRSGLIVREIVHHRPDVVCLQEVDHFRQFQQALQPHGYEGIYTKRTGDRRDGLAMFWRTDVMQPVKQRWISFNQFGMKDNVAQLVAFQPRSSFSSGNDASGSRTSSDGSAASLSGQKRRQTEQSTAAAGSRHLRFDSSSEGEAEDEASSSAKRRGRPATSSATAAIQSMSIADDSMAAQNVQAATPAGPDGDVSAACGSGVPVEDATERAGVAATDEARAEAAVPSAQVPTLILANIHVLFSPKRGDLKLGQVRTLMEHVDSMCLQQQKRCGQRAAAVVCGDFNSAAGSPIYEFVSTGQLDLTHHDRRRMSGQVEASGGSWRSLQQAFLSRQRQQEAFAADPFQRVEGGAWQQQQQQEEQELGSSSAAQLDAWPGQPPALVVEAATASLMSTPGQDNIVPPYAPPPSAYQSGGHSSSSRKSKQRAWTAEDLRLAAGSSAVFSAGSAIPSARHPLHINSAYRAVTGREAAYTTCHDKFIGCVDYVWFTPSCSTAGWRLQPLSVLEPPPLQTLHCALPSGTWPSDHISLVCDFALLPASAEAGQEQAGRRKAPRSAQL